MASLPPSADQAAESLRKLSLDPQTIPQGITEPSTAQYGGSVQIVSPNVGNQSQTAYYPNYSDVNNQWSDTSRPINHGVEVDMGNNQYMYNQYRSSSSHVPPSCEHFYNPQHYPYPGSFYQQPSTPIPNVSANRSNVLPTSHYSSNLPLLRYNGYGSHRTSAASQSIFTSARNQMNYPGHYTGYHGSRLTHSMYPYSQLYNPYGNVSTNYNFGLSRVNPKTTMTRCNENLYGYNELNRGPRAGLSKTCDDEKQQTGAVGTSMIPDKKMYNKGDFSEEYSDAKFFVIKSYSEDDVHKSIKYSVWSSTNNGNKKLNDAYNESREKAGTCPVFLFFSVNASGQFVGIAEMVGPVDFDKTVDYWHQDKWIGCFPVKWHVVKDVPNRILRQITLENNENKPVTNSRDTQEVKLEQGNQMIKIFKSHENKTSIVDDFMFYEKRERGLLQKNAYKFQEVSRQVLDEKKAKSEVKNEVTHNAESSELASSSVKHESSVDGTLP